MKKLLFIFFSFALVACGSGDETDSENGGPAYYISIGDKVAETDNDMDLGFMSDNIEQVTEFTLKDVKLTIKKMTNDFKSDPMSIEGKQYKGLVEKDESTHCTVSITKVTELETDDMKTDYSIEGTIKTIKDEGKFKVEMFRMNH